MPLKAHFLNVGHGDCTVVEHPCGRITMIDINNSKSLPDDDVEALAEASGLTRAGFFAKSAELTAIRASAPPDGFETWDDYYRSFLVDPTDWFLDRYGPDAALFRYFQTHPDMDHMSGLHRFFVQAGIGLKSFWDTEYDRERDDFDSSRYDPADWDTYLGLHNDTLVGGPGNNIVTHYRDATGTYWTDDNIEILGPTRDLAENAVATDNWNNLSYVLRVTHAGRRIILPGDAEKPAWDKIRSFDDPDGLDCDILKAAHHGRESGYSEEAVDLMDPAYVICSVGKKPSTDASDEYRSHGATVLSTRYHGSITVTIADSGQVTITDRHGDSIGMLDALSAGAA